MATSLGECIWMCFFKSWGQGSILLWGHPRLPWGVFAKLVFGASLGRWTRMLACLCACCSLPRLSPQVMEKPSAHFLGKFMGHSWPTSTGSYGGGPARCWGGLDHILGAYSGDCLAESLGKSCRLRGKSWQSPAKFPTSTYKVLVRSWPTLRGFLGDCFGGVPGGSLATSSGGSWPNFGGILGRWRVGVNGVIS